MRDRRKMRTEGQLRAEYEDGEEGRRKRKMIERKDKGKTGHKDDIDSVLNRWREEKESVLERIVRGRVRDGSCDGELV